MAGSSDGFRNVRFAEPEEKAGICSRIRDGFRKVLGRRSAGTVEEAPRQQAEPFVIGEPMLAVNEAAAPVEAKPNEEVEKFLASLGNGDVGIKARRAVLAMRGRLGRELAVEEAKEAALRDEVAGAEEMLNRRITIFRMAFMDKFEKYMKGELLTKAESVNAFYLGLPSFSRIIATMGVSGALKKGEEPEDEPSRAKCEDRKVALGAIEEMLGMAEPKDRLEALAVIAGIAEKIKADLVRQGHPYSKEVCSKVCIYCENMKAVDKSKMEALRDIAAFVDGHEIIPSGKKIDSGVPRAEERKIREWLEGRPEEIRKIAEAIMEREKPGGLEGFMLMLEVDPSEGMEKRLFVGEQVLARWTNTQEEFKVLEDVVARNVAYYCINDLLRVTSLADGLENAEQVKQDAVESVLAVAKRMPEGRRMEVPAIIAELVRMLIEGRRHKQWIVTDWLMELRSYMMEPDRERAYNKLARLRVISNPMEII